MAGSLLTEIAEKTASLPLEKQREVLDFVNAALADAQAVRIEANILPEKKPPFRSIRGVIKHRLEHLEEDLAEVRREMWQNFPREEPK